MIPTYKNFIYIITCNSYINLIIYKNYINVITCNIKKIPYTTIKMLLEKKVKINNNQKNVYIFLQEQLLSSFLFRITFSPV